jgi:hypothetical protein
MYEETNVNILTAHVFNFMKRSFHKETLYLWDIISQHLNPFSFSVLQFAYHPYWEVWRAAGYFLPV